MVLAVVSELCKLSFFLFPEHFIYSVAFQYSNLIKFYYNELSAHSHIITKVTCIFGDRIIMHK